MESVSIGTLSALAGLGIGAVVGAAAFISNFCALGAVADILFARDWRRMRAWMLAAGVALLGTQTLDSLGLIQIDLVVTPYILGLPALAGGLCFGFGMALAGGCVNRALVRLGAGSLKSLMTVLIVGIVAALTATWVLVPINAALIRWNSADVGLTSAAVRWIIIVIVAGGLIGFCLKDAWFRAARDQLAAGIIIGLMIPAAWLATDGERALNFVAPVGDLLMTLALHRTGSLFAMATVVGVPLGAFIAAAFTRNLALETFTDRVDAFRHVIGAALMGFGGTLALGCTFGQGLSGVSTLSITSFIAVAAMLFGCLWGIRYFEAEGLWGGLKLTFKRGL